MATAPHIQVYEVFEGEPSIDRGKMFPSPDYFFALATAMSCAEGVFFGIEDEFMIEPLKLYKQWMNSPPAETEKAFEWFCATCSQTGELTGEQAWKASPSDFSNGARTLLATTFFMHGTLDEDTAVRLALFYGGFEAAINSLLERYNEPPTPLMMVVRAITYPIRPLVHRLTPPYYWKLNDEEVVRKTGAALARVIQLLTWAGTEGRTFTFDAPEDQIEKSLDLGGMRIAMGKDGSVTMT